jgi:hypothetical protein
MFLVTEEAAVAIRTAFDQGGELAAAVELACAAERNRKPA